MACEPETCEAEAPKTRGETRQRAMMDAAWDAVLEKGISATTLDDIIARSGGSKSTLYAAFGDKEGLLRRVIKEKADACGDELSLTLDADQPPQVSLRQFGDILATKLGEPEVVRFTHLIHTEGHLFPALLRDFLRNGPERTEESLTRYLAEVSRAGKLDIADPAVAAELLMSMISGRWADQMTPRHGSERDLEAYANKTRTRIATAIEMFLAATTARRA